MKGTLKYNDVAAKIAEYCEKHSTINVAILFGSFLNSESYNDIDLGLYFFKEPTFDDFIVVTELQTLIGEELHIAFLNGKSILLQKNTINEGQVIYERDGDKYSDLIYKLIGEYFDYLDYHDPKQLYA